MKRTGMILAILASTVSLLSATSVVAGDRHERPRHRLHHRPHVQANAHFHNRHHRRDHQVNTYSGNLAIYYRRHVGTWSYGSISGLEETVISVPNAKIIDIDRLGKNAACSMENGVCVIRP